MSKKKQKIKRAEPVAERRATSGKKKQGLFDTLLSSLQKKLFGREQAPQTAQQSIPYHEMYKDGICRVTKTLFTKTVAFADISYQLAQNDDKTTIFEAYGAFLNYFDSSISMQLTCINKRIDISEFQRFIDIPEKDDKFADIRHECSEILKNLLERGNNGLVKTKYITFGIEAASLKEAKARLERIETDILNNFKTLGVSAWSLSGLERLVILHGQLHPEGKEKFGFSWSDIVRTGNGTKDAIAPTSFDFGDGRMFRVGKQYGAVSYVQILAPELSDRMLADFLDLDTALTVTLHIQSIDQAAAIKAVKAKLSDLDKMKIENVRPDRALCEAA